MAWSRNVTTSVYLQTPTALVDVSAYVRTVGRGQLVDASLGGRQTELDRTEPGRMTIILDNSSGVFTPGRASASIQLTLGMPVRITETIGYKTFPVFSGYLEMPDTTEILQGVDNLISVNAVDRKQLLNNGRTFVSTLAEYIRYNHRNTLVCYYPLNETAAPFLDALGNGPPFVLELEPASLPGYTHELYSPGTGTRATGDDISGFKFTPETQVSGGLSLAFARGYLIRANFTDIPFAQRPSISTGVPLTFVLWADLDGFQDYQFLIAAGMYDTARTQQCQISLKRNSQSTSLGASAGLLSAGLSSGFGGTLNGVATGGIYNTTNGRLLPFAIQLSYSPNTLKMWVGGDEFSAVPTGAPISPQQLYDRVTLGVVSGTVAHFQIHVGAFAQADFIAQSRAGQDGLIYQRTDERVQTILQYAAGSNTPIPAVLDDGSTYMQRAGLAGKRPGQAIDEAVDTERGRFFTDGAGISRFHSRTRTHYNV